MTASARTVTASVECARCNDFAYYDDGDHAREDDWEMSDITHDWYCPDCAKENH